MALKDKVSTALITDVGLTRGNNEDAVAEDIELGLLVLADGMGGYNAGEIASGIATSSILDVVRHKLKKLKRGAVDQHSGYCVESLLLREAVETANETIHQLAQSQPQCAGMGTTVVSVLLHDDRLSIAHVGDSRLYRFRFGLLDQLTRDHSLLEEMVARGHYTREEAEGKVRKNIVTRALGVEPSVEVDLIEETLEVGDVLLICSDGLSDMVPDHAITSSLSQHAAGDLNAAARALIDSALEAGGKDNVSVVLARVDASLSRGQKWYHRLLEWF
ncbi:MAG: Stp1/IreP family PP2C-type Ser/Thr phosphatase [Panacagrimonas sp.]